MSTANDLYQASKFAELAAWAERLEAENADLTAQRDAAVASCNAEELREARADNVALRESHAAIYLALGNLIESDHTKWPEAIKALRAENAALRAVQSKEALRLDELQAMQKAQTALRARLAEVEQQRDMHELKARKLLARLDRAERERDEARVERDATCIKLAGELRGARADNAALRAALAEIIVNEKRKSTSDGRLLYRARAALGKEHGAT